MQFTANTQPAAASNSYPRGLGMGNAMLVANARSTDPPQRAADHGAPSPVGRGDGDARRARNVPAVIHRTVLLGKHCPPQVGGSCSRCSVAGLLRHEQIDQQCSTGRVSMQTIATRVRRQRQACSAELRHTFEDTRSRRQTNPWKITARVFMREHYTR